MTKATLEIAMGATLLIGDREYCRIGDASIAVTDVAGETIFINLEEE